jgi:hypothetical protein
MLPSLDRQAHKALLDRLAQLDPLAQQAQQALLQP